MKLLILGGDKRYLNLIKYYHEKDLTIIGFDKIFDCSDIKTLDASLFDIIIFPVDGIKRDFSIYTPFNKSTIYIPKEFLQNIKKDAHVFTGTENEILATYTHNYIKVMEDDEVATTNGHLTVEGILADIIDNTNFSIKDSNIIVFGYGKIGKPLVKVLHTLGAKVIVGTDVVIDDYDYFLTTNTYEHLLAGADIIINTVPKILLDSSNMGSINRQCYLLDVASYPYGIDIEEALKLGLIYKQLPGIPGKISPKSASLIISKKINKYINKKEGKL